MGQEAEPLNSKGSKGLLLSASVADAGQSSRMKQHWSG